MKQRILSFVIITALMASVIAGAMGVSLNYAKAGAGEDIYSVDLRSYFLDLVPSQSSDINAFFDLVDDALEVGSGQCVFAGEKNGYWIINIYYLPTGTNVYSYSDYYGNSGISKSTGWPDVNFIRAAYFAYNGSITYAPTSDQFYALMGEGFNYSNPAYWSYYFVPNIFDYQAANVYSSIDILPYSGFSFSANFFGGSPEPEITYFDLGVFWLGNRQYLSILQQDLIRDLDPEHLNEASLIVYLYNSGEGDYKEFTYNDVSLLPGDWQFFINLNFTNVSPMGLYAIDITGNEWDIITGGEIVHFDDDYVTYAISDSRIEMNQGIPGTDGTPDSYTQSFNYFSEYVNNYNTQHVIPENLAETLFGLNGSKMYPCEVSVPVSISNEFDLTEATSFADVHNWRWWFSSRDDLGMNFELMDVCIIPMSLTGNYSIVYYYSDSLNVQFEFVSNMSFEDVCNNFDIVIIIPDDQHVLSSVNYWKLAYQSILAILNRDPSYFDNSWLSYQGITGSSSLGIEYLAARPDRGDYAGILDGFCIVTKKALQRQQLFVFNDGITKTYKLMSDYIENRGLWEDSFLAWTISLFEQWQTLDGRLSSIYNLLFDLHLSDWMVNIQTKLDQLVENTSETEWNYWYMDLFLWVNQFKPSNSDFIVSLNRYDDMWDDFPDLPAPTVIPLLPGD